MKHVDDIRCVGPFHRANRPRRKPYLFIFLVPGKIILYILLVPYRTSGAPNPVHQTQRSTPSHHMCATVSTMLQTLATPALALLQDRQKRTDTR